MYVNIIICIITYTYILFFLVNRRMDEWVSIDRINMSQGIIEDGNKDDPMLESLNGRERKVTRNLKRRHDEINHIQKVRYNTITRQIDTYIHTYIHMCICVHTNVVLVNYNYN